MGLTASTSGIGSAIAKQICVSLNTTSVVYVVPSGRTFVGNYFPTGVSPVISINGLSFSSQSNNTVPLTLVAGTVVAGTSTAGTLVGVEQ